MFRVYIPQNNFVFYKTAFLHLEKHEMQKKNGKNILDHIKKLIKKYVVKKQK